MLLMTMDHYNMDKDTIYAHYMVYIDRVMSISRLHEMVLKMKWSKYSL